MPSKSSKSKIPEESTWQEAWPKKARPKLSGFFEADVAIIGGGIAGLLSAYLLSKGGKKVVVLEKATLGSDATMNTTAFITKVIDTALEDLVKMFGVRKARLIWESGSGAIDELEEITRTENIDCEFTRCSLYQYARDEKELRDLEDEAEAAGRLGFDTKFSHVPVLPFSNAGHWEIPDQAKFHPGKFIAGLAAAIERHGGKIFERSEALEITGRTAFKVRVKGGAVTAAQVIVATYYPFNNPKKTHYKKGMYTSYVQEYRIKKGAFPEGMYLDLQNPYHYFRVDPQGSFDRVIVGGEDHRAEVPVDKEKSYGALSEYFLNIAANARPVLVRRWRGPILESSDGVALIGEYKPRQFVATAFSGNGMTYSMIAARLFHDMILREKNLWATVYDPKRPLTARPLLKKGMDYTKEFLGGAIKNTLRRK